MKTVKIQELENGNWRIELDENAMQALVSMVRLEYPNDWPEGMEPELADGGKRLFNAIQPKKMVI